MMLALKLIHSSFLPPATKLLQGYVFTRVCDSVHRRGFLTQCLLGYHPSWQQTLPGSRPPFGTDTTPQSPHPHPPGADPSGAVHAGRYGQQAGGTHPTGMHSFSYFVLNLAKFDEIQEKTKWYLSQNLDFNQTCIKGHVSTFVLLNSD